MAPQISSSWHSWFLERIWAVEAVLAALLLFICHLVLKKILRRFLQKSSFAPASLHILEKIFTLAVCFLGLLIVLPLFGLDIVPLLTFGGVGAAALAFASKDLVANFFGALMIYATRPFAIGDTIELPQSGLKGQVEHIGWYLTTVRDLQKKPIYIPNSSFTKEVLVNLSRVTAKKIEEKLLLPYADIPKVPQIAQAIRALFESQPSIDRSLPIDVHLAAFEREAASLQISAYTFAMRDPDFFDLRQKLLIETCRLIEEAGASIALPSLSVRLDQK